MTIDEHLDLKIIEKACPEIDEALFGDRDSVCILEKEYRPFSTGKVREIAIAEANLKFIQQNPEKINQRTKEPSDGALAALAGHHVIWILIGDRYTGAGVLDGCYTPTLHRDLKLLIRKVIRNRHPQEE
ncbi:hypothetical protein J7M28_06345 [bacterium]|nr:hypothetical protein [bacterium]